MTIARIIAELKRNRSSHALRTVTLKAVSERQSVSLSKRGADQLRGKYIRVFLYQFQRAVSVILIQTNCNNRANRRSGEKFD